MAMREDCKHYQSRTYPSGEVARLCVLNLAPEAPWRCPDNCARYEKRLVDTGFEHGSLVEPPVEDEPLRPDETGQDIAQLLNDAEDIVNSIVPEAMEEVSKKNDAEARKAAKKSSLPNKLKAKFRFGNKKNPF